MDEVRRLIGSSVFSDLDRHFARFIEAQACGGAFCHYHRPPHPGRLPLGAGEGERQRLPMILPLPRRGGEGRGEGESGGTPQTPTSGGACPALALAAALVSHWRGEGHICLDLVEMAGALFPEGPVEGVEAVPLPSLNNWVRELENSPVVGAPGEFKPLILDAQRRLYLHRYWEYEQSLAADILKRASQKPGESNDVELGGKLQALMPAVVGESLNWQCVAAVAAVRQKFCVISGGPGTGKTHALVLILALLLELERDRKLRIAVAAPTGKAATRIQDSIRGAKAGLACSEEIKAQLPERAMTIHRLLGYIPDSAYFRHNAEHPLPYDVVAVDEASMVDLALMAKLFQAIPASARVILLGDKDQLASVEAGAVLGDICAAGGGEGFSAEFGRHFQELTGGTLPSGAKAGALLADCVVQLRKNYRFGEQSSIYQLSRAINEGDAEAALTIMWDCGEGRTSDLTAAPLPGRAELKKALRDRVREGFGEFLGASDPLETLAALARFRVLCALRRGPFGVAGLNEVVEEILEEEGLIKVAGAWYAHRPIMVTRNDYNLKLFNGDIGVVLPDGASGEPRAYFPGPDNEVRKFLPLRLPEHETAYALTVHKSQGSEFDRVLFILPDRESPVLSRELLYTGITRARKSVEMWFEEKVFRAALSRRVRRTSGLLDALSGG